MYVKAEEEFIINGVKSWIHCIQRHHEPKPPNKPFSYHYHDYIELLFSLATNANVWLEGECYKFEKGDLIIINSGELHTVRPMEYSDYICIKFSPHILYAAEQALLEYKYVLPFLAKNTHKKKFTADEINDSVIPSLFIDTINEWENKRTAYELSIRSNILRIFAEIFRMNEDTGWLLPNLQLTDSLKSAIEYIHKNFSTATESEVAALCGLSYNHFSYSFKKATGQSFNKYVTAIKLREAEKQLVMTDKSITEIAYDVGFSNSSHFIKHFKSLKHITPSQFRSKMHSHQ